MRIAMKPQNIFVLTVMSLLCSPIFAENPCDRKVVMKAVDFPGNYKEDGFWAGMNAASDGKIYIGLNTEGGGHGHFYVYDPAKGQIRHIADTVKFLGESGKGIRTQSKIHSKFCEDKDGNIYFSTGNMRSGPETVDPMSWKGGHWCKYIPKTDKLEDLGPIDPFGGIYGMTIDKKRNLLFGTSETGHLMLYDISAGKTTDLGRVAYDASSVARTLICDDEGNVYGSFIPDRIFKYDSKSGRLLDLTLRIPSDVEVYPMTHSIYSRLLRVGVWDDETKKIYGLEGVTAILFEFDPKAGKEGEIKTLDRLLPPQSSEKIKKAHYATLSFTLGKDRKIYYMPVGSMDSDACNEGVDFFDWAGQPYLITYDLKTGKKECLGRIFTDSGEKVIDHLNAAPSGGATTGPDGTIYFCDFVEEKNPDLVARYTGKIPGRLKLLIYKPQN